VFGFRTDTEIIDQKRMKKILKQTKKWKKYALFDTKKTAENAVVTGFSAVLTVKLEI
jgi:hypothetical protein